MLTRWDWFRLCPIVIFERRLKRTIMRLLFRVLFKVFVWYMMTVCYSCQHSCAKVIYNLWPGASNTCKKFFKGPLNTTSTEGGFQQHSLHKSASNFTISFLKGCNACFYCYE
jgi:hypothetical protein